MSTDLRKIVSIVLSVAAVFVVSHVAFPNVASALTIDEIRAQIAQLTAALTALTGGAPVSATACTFTRNLTLGSNGDDVWCLQKYFNGAGFQVAASGAGSPGNETKTFGSRTKAAAAAWQAANGVSPAVGYFGSISRAKYGALIAAAPAPTPPTPPTPTTPGTPPPPGTPPAAPGTGLSIGLTPDQPVNALAPKNAARVPFTKFWLTAGTDGDVSVNGITVERRGPAADSNFSGVVLLDQNGNVLDIAKTLSSDHRATIGGTFKVLRGTTQMYTVAANIASGVVSGEIPRFAIVGVVTTATLSGSLPLDGGAQHTTNSTLTIGSITGAAGPADVKSTSQVSKDVGSTAVIFSEIRLTSGSNEDVNLKSIRWNQSGSASASDLGNVKTWLNGTSYDTVVSSDGKYYLTVFPGNGILMAKGNNLDVRVIGDVLSGSSRTIEFDIFRRETDIYAVGTTYGYGVIPANGAAACTTESTSVCSGNPWFFASTFSIQKGTITVSSDNAVPAQNIAVNLSDQPIGGFAVEVRGEPISVASTVFNVGFPTAAGSETMASVTQYKLVKADGTIVAGPIDGSGAGTNGNITFTDTITYPVGVTHLKLLGKIGTAFSNNDTIRASTTPSTHWTSLTGQVTAQSITAAPTSGVTANLMTIKGPTVTISLQIVPIVQTIIASGRYVFGNYTLDAGGSGEDVRVTTLPVGLNVGLGGLATDLTSCKLYNGNPIYPSESNALTTGSNVKNPTAAASSTTFTFDGAGLTLSKSTVATIALACSVRSGSSGIYTFDLNATASGNFAGTGLASGQAATITKNNSTGQGQTAAVSGTVTVTLDSSSPSYAIASPGQTVELARLQYSATLEDFDLRQVALVMNNRSTASSSLIDLVGNGTAGQVSLWTDTGTQIGTATFSSGRTATSTQIGVDANNVGLFRIPANGRKILIIKGTINAMTSNGPLVSSGDIVKVDFDGANIGLNGNYLVGVQSGSTTQSFTATTTVLSNGVRIMKAYPVVRFIPLVGGDITLTAGDNKGLYQFSINNPSTSNELSLYKFSFSVSSTTGFATTSKYALYAYQTNTGGVLSNPIPGYNQSPNTNGLVNGGTCYNGLTSNTATVARGGNLGNSVLVSIFPDKTACNQGTTTIQVPANTTYYFRLAASIGTLSPSGTAELLQAQMEGDAAYPVNNNATSTMAQAATTTVPDSRYNIAMSTSTPEVSTRGVIADANSDFIWSPRSTSTSASIFDQDWTNGYGIPGDLAGNNMTPQTISK